MSFWETLLVDIFCRFQYENGLFLRQLKEFKLKQANGPILHHRFWNHYHFFNLCLVWLCIHTLNETTAHCAVLLMILIQYQKESTENLDRLYSPCLFLSQQSLRMRALKTRTTCHLHSFFPQAITLTKNTPLTASHLIWHLHAIKQTICHPSHFLDPLHSLYFALSAYCTKILFHPMNICIVSLYSTYI